MAFFLFDAAAVCILTSTLTEQAVQVFGLFRDFGDWMDGNPKEQKRETRRAGKPFSRLISLLSFSEPEGDPTANGTATGADLGEYLSVVSV
jgi:hypothetical protein